MKTLGFVRELVSLIRKGEKTSTWRLFDQRNLKPGEVVVFEESPTKRPFALVLVKSVKTKRLEDVRALDFVGHEKYTDAAHMYETYRTYYGDLAIPRAPLRVIQFELLKAL